MKKSTSAHLKYIKYALCFIVMLFNAQSFAQQDSPTASITASVGGVALTDDGFTATTEPITFTVTFDRAPRSGSKNACFTVGHVDLSGSAIGGSGFTRSDITGFGASSGSTAMTCTDDPTTDLRIYEFVLQRMDTMTANGTLNVEIPLFSPPGTFNEYTITIVDGTIALPNNIMSDITPNRPITSDPAPITLDITGETEDQHPDEVHVFHNGMLLATVKTTSQPLGFPGTHTAWSYSGMFTPVEGANIITVRAEDTTGSVIGLSADVPAITVTLDTMPPDAPSISTAATTVATDTFTIEGTAEDGATVELFRVEGAGRTSLETKTITGTGWTFDVILMEGGNEFVVDATDATGNRSAVSTAVTITLDTTTPPAAALELAITTAATTVATDTFTIEGTAGAGATRVRLFRVGVAAPFATPTVTAGNWSADVALVEGANIITVIAIDAGSNQSAPSTIIITRDTTPPAVAISTAATTVMDAMFTIAGTTEAGATVEVLRAGTPIGMATVAGTDWTFDVTLDEGANVITATATDALGNESAASAPVTITLDSLGPVEPVITTTDTMTMTARFTIEGEAEIGATVELFRGGTSIGMTLPVTNTTSMMMGSWSIEVELVDGVNDITVIATDAGGNESPAADFRITVSGLPATPVITTTNNTLTMDRLFAISGTAGAGAAEVELFRVVGTTITTVGTTAVTGTDWLRNITLPEGVNTIVARATDAAGNVSLVSNPITVIQDSTPPVLAITTADPTRVTTTATFTIAGTTEAGAMVEVMKTGVAGTLGTVTVTGTNWTFDVSPYLTEGDNEFLVEAIDAAGNRTTQRTEINIILDTMRPTVTITRIRPAGTPAGATVTVNVSIPIQVMFSDPVSGFTEDDVTVSGGRIVSFSNYADRETYTFLVSPSEAGTLTVSIGADVVNDRAGNGNTAAASPLGIAVMSVVANAPEVELMDDTPIFVSRNSPTYTAVFDGTATSTVSGNNITSAVTTTVTDPSGNPVANNVIDTSAASEGVYVITHVIMDGATRTTTIVRTITVDTTPPQVSDNTISGNTNTFPELFTNAAGNRITLPTTEPVLVPSAAVSGFSLTTTVNGTNTVTHTVASVTAGSIVLNGVNPAIRSGAVINLTYTPPTTTGAMITDRAGNPLATLTRMVSRNIVAASSSGNVAIRQLNEAILSNLTQAVIASTAVSVERRVNVMLSDTPQTASYQLDGQTVQLDGRTSLSASFQDTLLKKLPSHNRSLQDGTMDWKRMLSKSSFVLPLDATSGSNGNFDRALSMWASSDYTKLGGDGATDWDGNVFGIQLGLDGRVREDMLLGGMISWSEGDVDYTQGNEKGRYQHQVTSIHPYLAWAEDEVDLWGSVGYGQGKLEIKAEGESLRSSDTKLLSLAAGGKQALSRAGFSLKSDILLASTRIDQSATIDADDISSQRLRLLLEMGQERRSASGLFTPLLEVGVRYDGGDGDTGIGAVLGAGLRHVNPVAGVTIEGKLHTLVGRSDYNEWGIQGLVRLQAGANERGLAFSLSPSYGHSGTSDASAMWQQNLSASTNDDDYHARMDADISYGLFAPGGRGLLTPYSAITLGNSSDRYRLGLRWKRNARLEMNLFGEEQADNRTVLLESRLRF